MKIGINKFIKSRLRELTENHARSLTSETAGSKNGSVSSFWPAMGREILRIGALSLDIDLRIWIMEPRSQKLEPGSWKLQSWDPGTFWEIECWTALQVTGKRGPVDPLLEYNVPENIANTCKYVYFLVWVTNK